MSGGLRISCFDACALQEDDTRRFWTKPLGRYFNPRPPCGGRPVSYVDRKTAQQNFNPRPPCGGRLSKETGKPWAGVFQSTSSVWRTTCCVWCSRICIRISIHVLRVEDDHYLHIFNVKGHGFQSTSSVWRTTAKTEKNLYLHSYNIAICTDLQSHQSVHAHVCMNNPKQSPQKPVRSIRVRSARFTFARPSPPGEALRKSARHPDGRRGERRRVPLCFGNGCPAGKSAGCPLPGRSIWPVQP